jgi:hypothetical protein
LVLDHWLDKVYSLAFAFPFSSASTQHLSPIRSLFLSFCVATYVLQFDNQRELYNKKLSCLGLLNAVTVKHDEVLKRLSSVIACCLTALLDLEDPDKAPARHRPVAASAAAPASPPPAGSAGSAATLASPSVLFPDVLKIPPQLHTEVQRRQLMANADPAEPINLRSGSPYFVILCSILTRALFCCFSPQQPSARQTRSVAAAAGPSGVRCCHGHHRPADPGTIAHASRPRRSAAEVINYF